MLIINQRSTQMCLNKIYIPYIWHVYACLTSKSTKFNKEPFSLHNNERYLSLYHISVHRQNVKEEPCLRRAARKWKTQAESSAYNEGSQWFCTNIPADGLSQTRKKTRLSHFLPSCLHDIPCNSYNARI